MVTPHPPGETGQLLRGKKCPEAHIQFFGRPPTRGWVPVNAQQVLTEDTIGRHREDEEGFMEAVQGAREAIGLSPQARLEGLMVDIPSEGEEEGEREGGNQENIEPMDATPSGRKRPRPMPGSDEDSDSEIGVRRVGSVCVCVCVCE